MPPFTAKPFEPTGTGKSGFTISVAETKGGQHIRIGISEAAQTQHFGGPLDPQKDALKLFLNNDQGKNHILAIALADIDEASALRISAGGRHSVSVKLEAWTPLAKGKRPPTELIVLASQATKHVHVKLPEYARPQAQKIGQGKSIMD